MIFRVTILIVASVIALSVSYKRKHFNKHLSEEDNGHGCQQIREDEKKVEDEADFTEETEGFQRKTNQNLMRITDCDDIQICRNSDRLRDVLEFQRLEKELKQRKMAFEVKMLQLYNLKEQQSQISHLQKHLQDRMEEIKTLNITVNSLKSETKCLQEEIKQSVIAEKQLRMAKKVMEEPQTGRETKAIKVKLRLMMLEKQVSEFQTNDYSSRDTMGKKRLEDIQDMELQVLEMKRRKNELEFEKRTLAVKLESAHAKIAASAESKFNSAKVEEEANTLRHANEDLCRQVDRLQEHRFNMVEELVYLRWLNACMRFESHNHKLQLTKALNSDDPRRKSQDHPIFDDISSRTSPNSESEDIDSSTIWSSSSSQRSAEKKESVFHCIKSWGGGGGGGRRRRRLRKDSSQDDNSSIKTSQFRRFSDSMVPSKPSMLISKHREDSADMSGKKTLAQDLNRSVEKHRQIRRVSFSDEIETVPRKYYRESTATTWVMSRNSKVTGERLGECEADEFSGEEKLQESSIEVSSNVYEVDKKKVCDGDDGQVAIKDAGDQSNNLSSGIVEVHMVRVIFAFFFLLVMFLLCFLFLNAGVY